MLYISNAFSCQMVTPGYVAAIRHISKVDVLRIIGQDQKGQVQIESVVGHPDIAAIIQNELIPTGVVVEAARKSIQLTPADDLLVCQYNGGRLPEGTTRLPVGATVSWYLVECVLPSVVPSRIYH